MSSSVSKQKNKLKFLYFKALVADNGRLGRLYGIVQALDTIMSAHKGDVSASVTTAKVI